jgi:Holliday junction resolvase RusA-like endonuclease
MIQITIPLPPVPWQASIKGKYTFYDPKEKEKRCARFYIKEQYKGPPIEEFTVINFQFYFKIPKSFSKKKMALARDGYLFPTRSDCTNLQKLYEDCLKGIVIKDDRTVVKVHSEKFYKEKDSVVIRVFTIDEYYYEWFGIRKRDEEEKQK